MSYYIKYSRRGNKVKITKRRPSGPSKGYGFAEGGFKSVDAVKRRLNMMDVPATGRPKKFR